MTYVNPYLEEKAAEYRRQDYRHQAAVERMCCDAGIDQRGPIARLLCRVLCQTGRLLMTGGRRLEEMGRAGLTGTSQPAKTT
jgi:3'-phosphoadenosine 5'-phosphosulfate sulfotransferase (PAPS reductase)/FAD synthetase